MLGFGYKHHLEPDRKKGPEYETIKTSYDFLTVLRTNSTHCMPTRSATHLKYVTGLITSPAWLEWPAVLVYLNMTSFPALEVAWIDELDHTNKTCLQ